MHPDHGMVCGYPIELGSFPCLNVWGEVVVSSRVEFGADVLICFYTMPRLYFRNSSYKRASVFIILEVIGYLCLASYLILF